MLVRDYRDIKPNVEHGLPGVTARWPIRQEDGAPHFAMRVFEIEPGCSSPLHTHWWEHEVFVLAGQGYITTGVEGERFDLHEGITVLVMGDEPHQLVNTGSQVLRFICLIPHPWLEGAAAQRQR